MEFFFSLFPFPSSRSRFADQYVRRFPLLAFLVRKLEKFSAGSGLLFHKPLQVGVLVRQFDDSSTE